MALVESGRAGPPAHPTDFTTTTATAEDYGPAPIDFRLRYPLRWMVVLFVLLGFFLGNWITATLGPYTYSAEARLLGLKLDDPSAANGVEVHGDLIQSIMHLARSDAYVNELAQRAGVEPDLDRLKEMIEVERPRVSAIILIRIVGRDGEEIDALAGQLVPVLNTLIDRARAGAVVVLDENGRNPFAGADSDYRGPMYLDVFQSRPDLAEGGPPASFNALVGAVLGALLLLGGALALHGKARIDSREDLTLVLGLPQIANLPRLGLRPKRQRENYLKGVALAIDGVCPGGVGTVALVGKEIGRERANAGLAIAAGLASTVDRQVVVVDLDVERAHLSRRLRLAGRFRRRRVPGVTDVLVDGLALEPLVVPVKTRRLPRSLRRMVRASDARLFALGVGSNADQRVPLDEDAVVDMIGRLMTNSIVVMMLPRIPGPVSVQGILGRADVTLLTVLDGWSELRPAVDCSNVLASVAAGRAGFVLLEN